MTLYSPIARMMMRTTLSLLFQLAAPSSFVSMTLPPRGVVTYHRTKDQYYNNKLHPKLRDEFYLTALRDVIDTAQSNFYHDLRCGASHKRIAFPPLAFASTMSFLAGFSDAVCFRRFHCYTSMMTGNIITMSVALAEGNWIEVAWKLSLIASFFFGACAARTINSYLHHNRDGAKEPSKRQHLKFIAVIVFGVFALYDHLPGNHRWGVTFLALAYGMVYSSANQALDATITQLMTGHITKFGTAISDRFLGPYREWNKGISMSLCIVCSFVIGVVLGARVSTSSFGKEGPFFSWLGFVYALALALY